MSQGGVLRHEGGKRYVMVLPDVDGGGKWRIQRFDKDGFSGHEVFKDQAEATQAAINEGFKTRDDGALDAMQATPEWDRGMAAADIIRRVNGKEISFAEGNRLLAEYDAKQKPAAKDDLPVKFKSTDGTRSDYGVYVRRVGQEVRVSLDTKTGEFGGINADITAAEKEDAKASVRRFIRKEAEDQIKWFESKGMEVPADLRKAAALTPQPASGEAAPAAAPAPAAPAVVSGARGATDEAGRLTPEKRQELQDARQMVEDMIATKRANREVVPDAWVKRLADLSAQQRGEKADDGAVYSLEVEGHPMYDGRPVLRNLVPIKVSSVADAQRKLDNANTLEGKVAKEFYAAQYDLKQAKTAAQKKAAKARLDKLNNQGWDEDALKALRDTTIAELSRLVDAAQEKFGAAPQPTSGEAAPAPAPEAERYAAGRALTKEQRKQVLDSLVDVYKAKGAPREMKGIGRDGNERYGYVHSPELFEKSDITGAMVRYYVTLPDGRRAHPTELFPDYTQADVDAALAKREADEKADRENQAGAEARADKSAAPTVAESEASWKDRNKGLAGNNPLRDWRTGQQYTLVTLEKGGKFYSVRNDDAALMGRLERGGWKRAEAAPAATPAPTLTPKAQAVKEALAAKKGEQPKRDEYPLGKTDREDRFFGTRVRVLPELKGDTAWEGVIQMTLNGGRLFSVKRADNDNGSFRIGGDRLEILEVKDAEKADTKPKEPTKAPASINLLPLAEKWDALVEHTKTDGGDPDKGQRSYRALTQLIGGFEEKPLEVWDRWSTAMGSTGLVDLTGPQVLKWLEANLPTALDGYIRNLPGATMSSTNAGDVRYWQNALAEIERRTPDYNRYVDKLEKQALDVERLGGDAERVAEARKTIDRVKRAFNANERSAQQGLASAEGREKAEAEKRAADEAAKYQPFNAKELSKKPTPASMFGWFTANYDGKTVWTQGTILDLSGEPPHLAGYEDRRDTLGRNKDGKLDVSRVIPRERGPEAVPFGFYDGEFGKTAKNGVVYFDAEGRLVGADATLFRYFASKFKGATFYASPNNDVLTVRQDGKTVGVLMPIKLGTDAQPAPSVEELRTKIAAKPAPAPAPQPEAEAPAPAAGKQYPTTAEGAIQAFNDDDSAQAVAIMAKLKLDDLKTVGDAVGFRPQYNETAKAFRERIGAVAGKLEKTSREKARRQRVLFDKLTDRAMAYDRAADHAARAKANGVADDSTAYDSFYTPMGGGETQMMRIPAMLDRLAEDVKSLQDDPDYAEVAPLVQKARPRVFEHKASAAADRVLTIESGGSTQTLTLPKPAWQATDDELVQAVKDSGTYLGKPGSKYDPYRQWREAHSEAIAKAVREGKQFPDELLYDKPALIRTDLSDDQADEASDAMTAEYRASGDYGKAVQVYREWGKKKATSAEAPKAEQAPAEPAAARRAAEEPTAPAKPAPKSFRKSVKVKTAVFMEETGTFADQEVDADTALKALDADIDALTAFRKCITGG